MLMHVKSLCALPFHTPAHWTSLNSRPIGPAIYQNLHNMGILPTSSFVPYCSSTWSGLSSHTNLLSVPQRCQTHSCSKAIARALLIYQNILFIAYFTADFFLYFLSQLNCHLFIDHPIYEILSPVVFPDHIILYSYLAFCLVVVYLLLSKHMSLEVKSFVQAHINICTGRALCKDT